MVFLIADKLGDARFGITPKHAIVRGIKVVGVAAGKIKPGERFEFHGDTTNPPKWASPTCPEGEKMYAAAAAADRIKANMRLARLRKEIEKVEADVATTPHAGRAPRTSKVRGAGPSIDPSLPPGAGPQRPTVTAAIAGQPPPAHMP